MIGLSCAAFYGRMETEEQAAHLRDFPLDTCEVFLQTPSEYQASFGSLVRRRLSGLPCASVHAKGTQFEPDLFGASARQRADALATLCGALDAGQALGARWYVFHGPGGVKGPITPDRIAALPERFARMQQEARRRGLEILWENVSWCALRRPEDVRTALRLLPDLHFVMDIKQAFRGQVDPFAMLDAMGSRVRHVHVLDWDESGALCLPGQGVMDFDRLFRQLRDQGYNGAVILEPYATQAQDEDGLRRSLDFLREKAARSGPFSGQSGAL